MTLIRLYCGDCDETTVVNPDELDTDWKVDSLATHAGTCPRCRKGVEVSEEGPDVETGGQPTLTAFAMDGGERQ